VKHFLLTVATTALVIYGIVVVLQNDWHAYAVGVLFIAIVATGIYSIYDFILN